MSFPSVYEEQEFDNFIGARPRTRPGEGPNEDKYEPVKDAYGNTVSGKPSNRAMLAAQRRRLEHERRVAATPPLKINISSLLLLALFLPLLSSFLTTDSYTFNLAPLVVPPVRRWWLRTPLNPLRRPLRTLSPAQLGMYDGSDPKRPLYLAIDGDVYDVSANRRIYGPGGSYHLLAGRDASRSFVTGCFDTHRTHDLRGFNDEDLKALDSWKDFFAKHERYTLVGRVTNPPIDPASPIPEPCEADASSLGSSSPRVDGQGPPAGRHAGRGP